MDYNEFSEKIKQKYPQYQDIDNKELAQKMIAKYPEYKEQVTFDIETPPKEQPKGIDLTPAGFFKGSQDIVASVIAAPKTAEKKGVSLKDAYNQNRETLKQYRKNNPTPVQDLLVDTAAYSLIPESKAVAPAARFISNVARYATVPGALESLKQGKNPLVGGLIGTGIGAGVQAVLPPILKGTGAKLKEVAENPNVQKNVAKTIEFLTSVPEKFSNLAIEKELAGKSILEGKINPDTAYQGVERKIRTARGLMPSKQQYNKQYKDLGNKVRQKLDNIILPETVFDEKIANLGQKAVSGLDYLKTNAENKIMEALETLDNKIAGTNNVKNAVNTIINQFGKGGVYNSAKEEAPQVVNYLEEVLNKEGLTLRDLHRIKERLYDLGYQADNLKQGTAAQVARGAAGQINNYLRSVSPGYIQPNELYASIVGLEKELGGLNGNTIGAKLKNYGDSAQILSGFKEKLQNLNDILPDEMKFLDDVQKINALRLSQEQLQKNLPEGVLNDISKYQNAPLEVQNALEKFAPEELNAYRQLFDRQATQNNILSGVPWNSVERNPRLLTNRNDLKAEEALGYLQDNSGINFMDELNEIRAREALEKFAPGQGGGSGGEQGFWNNVARPVLQAVPKTATAAILGNTFGGPLGAIAGLGMVSPKIMGQGLIKGLGALKNNAIENLSPLAQRLLAPLIAREVVDNMPKLYGGVKYNEQ